MNFDLHPAADAARTSAGACASAVVAPAAADIDAAGHVPDVVRAALSAALPASVAADGVAWVVAIEELAVVSAAAALVAAGSALGVPGAAAPAAQWPGLRGADVDALRPVLAGEARGELAITAVLLGLARAAVEQSRAALRAARVAGTPREAAESSLADAATLVDGARLLLWDAAAGGTRDAATGQRSLARLQALAAGAYALTAAAQATAVDAARPGTPLDRLTRDWSSAARVLGEAEAAERVVAAAVLPA